MRIHILGAAIPLNMTVLGLAANDIEINPDAYAAYNVTPSLDTF